MAPPLRLSVLGTEYEVSLDHPGLQDAMTALFGRFLVDEAAPALTWDAPAVRRLDVRAGEEPAVVLDGVARPLSGEAAGQQAFVVLNETFLREANGCRVLHAAALTREGKAVLVAGPSTYGKSTLALLLLERGLGFLGDDYAPLDMATGQVLPFPKTIGLRPGVETLLSPLTRARLDATPERRLGSKRLVDIDELFPGQLAGPAPVGMVVLLAPPPGEPAPPPGGQPLLIGTLGELPGLGRALEPFGTLEGPLGDEAGPIRHYAFERRGGKVRELAAALDPFGDRVLFVEKVAATPPRFEGEPWLLPCMPSEGLLSLAADLLDRSGPRGRLLDDAENSAALVFELSRWLGRARYYRLHLGRFAAMADAIARAAREMR